MGITAIKLRHLATIRAGHPFRERVETISDGGTPIISVKDLPSEISAEINRLELKSVRVEGRKKPAYLKPGDILFSGRGLHYSCLAVIDVDHQVIASPHLLILTLKKKDIDPEYLSWYISHSKTAKSHFARNTQGSSILHVPRSALEELPVTVPPIEKQRKIVQAHKAWKREKAVLTEILERREAIINNCLEKALKPTGA